MTDDCICCDINIKWVIVALWFLGLVCLAAGLTFIFLLNMVGVYPIVLVSGGVVIVTCCMCVVTVLTARRRCANQYEDGTSLFV